MQSSRHLRPNRSRTRASACSQSRARSRVAARFNTAQPVPRRWCVPPQLLLICEGAGYVWPCGCAAALGVCVYALGQATTLTPHQLSRNSYRTTGGAQQSARWSGRCNAASATSQPPLTRQREPLSLEFAAIWGNRRHGASLPYT